MPKDSSIKHVLIIGSGPIIIGQACEFDYSGSQAARSLREEGITVSLINSNPATIMTDKMNADHVYLWPLTPQSIEKILQEQQIDCVLPTMGGQTALNLAKECDELGIWEKYNCRIIGVNIEAIDKMEDRDKFKDLMIELGVGVAESQIANSFLEGKEIAQRIGFPLVIRPSYTLGGTGGSIVFKKEEFDAALQRGLEASPVHEVLVEQAVMGWKEYELELLRRNLHHRKLRPHGYSHRRQHYRGSRYDPQRCLFSAHARHGLQNDAQHGRFCRRLQCAVFCKPGKRRYHCH
jgi:carbamoyl-phosphate synthase large subunit